MKAAIYNPYLDTLGGGERYTMSFAKVLVENGYTVNVEWKDELIKKKLEERFGLDLTGLNFIPSINRGDGYDVCFWLSDGSIPLLRARKNFLHFQVPFRNVGGKTLLNKMKLFRINKIICNSLFTKNYIDNEYGVESLVVYPPVAVTKIKPKKKENIILAVARFSQLKQVKRHDILIKAFKKIYDSGFRDWKLILAGGTEVGSEEYLTKLEKSTKGYPIEICKSPSFQILKDLYGKAKIFWSAAGYGIDESKEPEKVEHFGISVVEAMAGKCVPVILNAGGHREIIENEVSGFFYQDSHGLIKLTEKLIDDPGLRIKIADRSKLAADKYSYSNFQTSFLKLLNHPVENSIF